MSDILAGVNALTLGADDGEVIINLYFTQSSVDNTNKKNVNN